MKPIKHYLSLCAVLFFVASSAAKGYEYNIPVFYDTLANGMRYIIVPDSTVAVVSCRLYYFVGSMYEGPGTSGLSHLYEHMMFKGTKTLGTKNYAQESTYISRLDTLEEKSINLYLSGKTVKDSEYINLKNQIYALLEKQREFIKKDEIWELYQNNGATNLNAWTSDDLTAYIVTLPQNKIELFFWIEADRMQNIVLREFFSERDVVIEERHMRYENKPANKYFEKLFELFYTAHPYRVPTIGWMSDLYSHSRKKLSEFVNRYYTPDNALVVFVGNVDKNKIVNLLDTYFSKVPRAASKKQEVSTREAPPIGETRFTMYEDVQPRLDILFHTPGYPHEDLYSLDVIEGLLTGRSGRLYQRLVNEEKLCTDAGAQNSFRLHDGYFHIFASLKNETRVEEVEKCIWDEIIKLTMKQPTDNDMTRIKNTIQMQFVTQLQSLEGQSDQLAWFERLRSWKDLLEYPAKIDQIIPEKISGSVDKYLSRTTATIGILLTNKSKNSLSFNERKN